jgi:sugar lactone lactonase YvrE
MQKTISLLIVSLIILSCQGKKSADNSSNKEPLTFSVTKLWSTDTIMKTPESVLFDPVRNVLYVANMNRVDKGDNTGFITKMNTDGTVIDLHWVDELNEPRGMGIYDNQLYATDMNRLVVIDLETGELVESIPVEGAAFLNDLAIGKDGTVYFSDSGAGKLQYYKDGRITDWFPQYPNPNGLADAGEDLIVCATKVGEIRRVNKATGEYEVMATGINGDGIEHSGIQDYYIVTEWEGRMHVIGNDTIQTVLDTSKEKINSADIGYNPDKKIIYVPTFFDNRVVAYELKE